MNLNKFFINNSLSKIEYTFLSIIFIISFIPFYNIGDIFNHTEVSFTIFLLATILLTPLTIRHKLYRRKNGFDSVFFLFSLILILGIFNTIIINSNILESYDWLTLTVIFLSMFVPFLFVKIIRNSVNNSRNILAFTAIVITFSSSIYFLYKYVFLQEWNDRFNTPFGGAAVVHVVFLLTSIIFFGLISTEKNKKAKIMYAILLSLSVIFLFSTGSRAGFISSVLFIVLFLLLTFKKNLKRISKKSILIFIVTMIISLIIFMTLNNTRLFTLTSVGRSVGYLNSLELSLQSIKTFLFGYGYSEIWDWYGVENSIVQHPYQGSSLYLTKYGLLLYHSHSTFLELLVEFGFISVILFCVIIYMLFNSLKKYYRDNKTFEFIVVLGLISTIPCFSLDLYLFKNWFISFFWWSVLFFIIYDSNQGCIEENKLV